MPTCWIIAGPNGAGKTTFALEYLPKVAGCTHFINAYLLAFGLSSLASESNHLETLDSVQVVKIIREALKK